MNEIITAMTEVQTILFSLLSILLGVVAYFLVKRDKAISKATDNLFLIVGELKILVNTMTSQYAIRQPIIDQQLELHRKNIIDIDDKVDKVDSRLTTLETEHRIICGKSKKS